jgi:alcohol dehydrogenase
MSRFIASNELYFGPDALDQFFLRLEDSYPECLVIYDANLLNGSAFASFMESIKGRFSGVKRYAISLFGEPTYQLLDQIRSEINREATPDIVIAIGGGSVMDIGKALAVLLTSGATESRLLRGMNKVKTPGIPTVLVPTTAGTGSEVTYTASLIDEASSLKLGINGDHIFAKFAVFCPEFVVEAPKHVTMGSALDALVHATEAISSVERSMFSTPMASRAITGIIESLPLVLDDGQTPEVQIEHASRLQQYAAMAGIAMLNSSGGVSSAISYPVGVRYRVPHGFAGGIPLPKSVELLERNGFSFRSYLHTEKNLSELLSELYRKIGAPSNFSTWGITADDADVITGAVLEEKSESLSNMPFTIKREVLKSLLLEVLNG